MTLIASYKTKDSITGKSYIVETERIEGAGAAESAYYQRVYKIKMAPIKIMSGILFAFALVVSGLLYFILGPEYGAVFFFTLSVASSLFLPRYYRLCIKGELMSENKLSNSQRELTA